MKIVDKLENIPSLPGSTALSIGVFDGVHLGHQAILKQLKKHQTSAVLTFSNHPSTLLRPNHPVPMITTLDHRLKLLEDAGIDLCIALPFTQAFAAQSYEAFFQALQEALPFESLIVGGDARFGKERAGGPKELHALGINATFLKKETYHKEEISSGRVRTLLQEGKLKKVKKMLGRPYSIVLPFDQSSVIRENEVQFKWATGTQKLCLLPSAVYAVDLHAAGEKPIPAIAFYRGTQTITNETETSLTLYFEKELPETHSLEIVFSSYLHDELDPDLSLTSKRSLLEPLKLEFFAS